MDGQEFLFFERHPQALPLYEAFVGKLGQLAQDVEIRVQKTQISFYRRHLFACVSFARVRRKQDCPEPFLVVTFGLGRKVESPRIDAAVEPYPGRWTHHVLISDPAQADEELMGWVMEAYRFAEQKAGQKRRSNR